MDPLFSPSGVFIAFEGGDGGGKSTQARLLAEQLRARGLDVLLTREPGGTEVGAALRSIVLDPATGDLSPRTEMLIYAADKAEHVDAVVLPALAAGRVVVTDRYVDSTLAYQGVGRGLDLDEMEAVARWATGSLRPHLTVLLDIDPAEAFHRFDVPDRMEAEPPAFHARVRAFYLELAARDPEHYAVIDAAREAEAVLADVVAAVEPLTTRAAP